MSVSTYLLSFACSPSPLQQQHPSQTSHCCSRSSKVVSNATYCLADGIGLSGQINTLASEIPNQCSCSRGRIQISTARYWHGKTLPTLCCLNLPVTSIATSPCFVVGGLEFKAEDNVAASKTCAEGDPQVLIECRNVYKSFGEKQILKGANFKIRHGEAVGIIGPSGTGKSTILRIMAGLLIPDKGEVFVCGKKRKGLISDEELPGLHIGLVFQSAALFDSLTVRENVGFMLDEHFNLSNEKVSELVTESLAAVGLKGVEDRLPAELSGGMKKRVALARAIISDNLQDTGEPEVVMYDEPTAGLDPIASTVVEDLIRSVHIKGHDARGKPGKISSYVVVTHQHSTIRRAVDRILFLHDGEIVWEGTTAEFDTTTNLIVRQFAEGSLHGPIRY